MISECLRKKLNSKWIKNNKIWDIVLYGSVSRGKIKARDIDLAIILAENTPLKKKLSLCQELRRIFSGFEYVFDIKAIDFNDLLNPGFLGREAILAEGISLLKKDCLAERFGFSAFTLVKYRLKNLTLAKQKTFYYALQGRKKGKGILAKLEGSIISKGILKVPTRHMEEIKEILEQHKVDHEFTFNLTYRILH